MPPSVWQILFGFRDRIPRGSYARLGVILLIAKYIVDASIIWLVTKVYWTPWDYIVPLHSLRGTKIDQFPAWLAVTLIVWTLPFLWIGVSMTVRRAADAGWSPWTGLWFFVPIVNYVVMLVLCVVPSAPKDTWSHWNDIRGGHDRFRSAMLGIAACLVIGILGLVVNVGITTSYGLSLFLATPFILGTVSAFVFNRGAEESVSSTIGVVTLGTLLVGGTFIAFALEGLLCLLMALPLGLTLAILGGLLGRAIARRSGPDMRGMAMGALIIPGSAVLDRAPQSVTQPPTFIVATAIDVDAPRDVVWRHVVEFHDIQAPPELPFKLGLAYPIRARIMGRGVGAIRRCEFSTGAFVEPITVWDAPARLAFDVTAQPVPLREWSPYQRVYAPHVHGFFRSQRGEFRLTPLPHNRTRLEGRTWYHIDIHPQGYWRWMSELIVSRIHHRVLAQVEQESVAEFHATR